MEIKFIGNQINFDIIFGFKKKIIRRKFKVELLQWTAIGAFISFLQKYKVYNRKKIRRKT
jgi:hypothetical protein